MKATWNGTVIAEAPRQDLIFIEGNWYFPPKSVDHEYLRSSPTQYTCPWKGECAYYEVGKGDDWAADAAWCYPNPKSSAIERVKKDFSGHIAFWREVTVSE